MEIYNFMALLNFNLIQQNSSTSELKHKPKVGLRNTPATPEPIFKFNSFKGAISEYKFDSVIEKAKLAAKVKNKEDVIKITGLSRDCIDRIVKYESIELKAYVDGDGNKTIGIGHNINADKNYKYGNKITEEQAWKLFAQDLLENKEKIEKSLGKDVKLTNGQVEALLDISFNMGFNGLKETSLFKLVQQGKFDKAVHEFDIIYLNKKNVSTSLCMRRMEDLHAFMSEQHNENSEKAVKDLANKGVKSLDKKIPKARKLKQSFKNQKTAINDIKAEILNPISKYFRDNAEIQVVK